ncbi:hypothetical protein RMSM_01533 [Rhodopirellula maiorica SM1]|uniref:Uncharacterized protein n=1 Tax=Rhodopirellula maiorica SM1 TaxID=1265738 RepID=M5RQB7_9BACT|nr:hypothetical protein RMSM_01533 [Rhodopirellula maiorica SM1]
MLLDRVAVNQCPLDAYINADGVLQRTPEQRVVHIPTPKVFNNKAQGRVAHPGFAIPPHTADPNGVEQLCSL